MLYERVGDAAAFRLVHEHFAILTEVVEAHRARREATRRRLMGEGELPDRAEALVAAWEARADEEGLERDGRYWDAGWAWMVDRRARG